MKYFLRKIFTTILIVAAVIITACSSEHNASTSSQQSFTGTAQLRIDYYDSSDISQFAVTVSAPDMTTMAETFTMADELNAVIYNVPVGDNRLFAVSAYNTSDLLIFSGSATSDIVDGETATVHITLVETNPATDTLGDAQINGFSIVSTPGIPFGFWGLNGFHTASGFADVQTRFGITVFQVAAGTPSWTVSNFLPLVRAAGLAVTLRLTNNPVYSGSFNINTWKTQLDAWVGSGVQEFIDDGTLVGHMLIDDIYNFTGADPTAAELDEMARYSQEKLPGLFTFVREQASNAPIPVSGTYTYVDAFVNQYASFSDGPIDDYVQDNVAAAESLGVGIIMGLNLCDGGDGSSGQRGWRTDRVTYAMSAAEITTYGEALLAVPDVLMFLMWEYDGLETWSDGSIGSDYFDQTDLQDALYQLSQTAAAYH
jgi:hypothetical protein